MTRAEQMLILRHYQRIGSRVLAKALPYTVTQIEDWAQRAGLHREQRDGVQQSAKRLRLWRWDKFPRRAEAGPTPDEIAARKQAIARERFAALVASDPADMREAEPQFPRGHRKALLSVEVT